jgi:hypothetical protein
MPKIALRLSRILAATLGLACAAVAGAQTDSVAATRAVDSAGIVLDAARSAASAPSSNVQNVAAAVYAAAVTMLGQHNYVGAQRLAATAVTLARCTDCTPREIGPHLDSVPFGVETIGPGEPPIKPAAP